MADDDFDTDDTGTDDEDMVPRSHIRQLEESAKRSKELEARLAEVEREAAFAKALGTATTVPAVKDYFMPAYKGELSVEAIQAAAKEAGFLAPAGGTTVPDDSAAHHRITGASEGAGEPAPADLHAAINAAKSESEVLDILEAAGVPTTRTSQ